MTLHGNSKQANTHRLLSVARRCFIGPACLVLLLVAPSMVSARGVAVLEFELNDLTLNPDLSMETRRTATLRPLLVAQLAGQHGLDLVENPASAVIESGKGRGYLFDRPALAAKIGREAGADWIVSGRLHKASFLFVYLKAQLIDCNTGRMAADFVVEIKGPQEKLTKKGIESLARQISDAIDALEAGS